MEHFLKHVSTDELNAGVEMRTIELGAPGKKNTVSASLTGGCGDEMAWHGMGWDRWDEVSWDGIR